MIDDILEDTTHGSSYLAKTYLQRVVDNELDREQILEFNTRLASKFSDMAIIENIINELNESKNPRNTAVKLMDQLEEEVHRICEVLENRLTSSSSILTFSHSQTVEDVVKHLSEGLISKIYCMESQPGGEGSELSKNINGSLVVDLEGLKLLSEVDVVLFGCDRYNDDYFVNKLGTSVVCELAEMNDVTCYVLTSQLKCSNVEKIDNPMFELISRKYVQLVTD